MAEEKERIEEIKELLTTTPQELTKEVNIIYDKIQYSIRIPKSFAEKIALNPEKDKILFKLYIPSDPKERMRLTAEVIKNEKET